jgi:SLOG cluster2
MTQNTLARSVSGRMDLLRGLRIGISGSVPEERYWKRPNQNEQILAFVGLLSDLVMKYGGRVVHGNHPSFTPIIVGRANKHFGPRADGKPATVHPHPPPVVIVGSRLWLLEWEFPLLPGIVEVIETPTIGDGGVTDVATRNNTLTALRLALLDQADVIIAVGGKLHRGTGFNPGVLEELTIARWSRVPCIIVAGFSGLTAEMDLGVIHWFCPDNGLEDEELERLASTDQDIELCAGGIVAHLAKLVRERQADAFRGAGWATIPTREASPVLGVSTRLAEVPEPLVHAASGRFAKVRAALEASDIDLVQELLSNPPASTGP